jgi:hypothetical protein
VMIAPDSIPAGVAGLNSIALAGAAPAINVVIAIVSSSARFIDHLPALWAPWTVDTSGGGIC